MLVQAYLCYEGRCEEALEFYKKAIGAEVTAIMRFSDSPDPAMCPTGQKDKIMHSNFNVGETQLMASDGRCTGQGKFEGIALALEVADDAEAKTRFEALAEGGQITMPLMPTFWTSSFGMVNDKFGVGWMVSVKAA